MKLKTWQKNILYMFVIVGVGFILFNLAFILAGLVRMVYSMIVMRFVTDFDNARLIPFSWHYVYIIFVLLLSWFVLTRPLKDLTKATYFTMPLIVVLTEVGVQFYRWPVLVWVIGAIIVGAVIFYLNKTKRSWLYYFATFYVVLVEIFVMLSGMDI
ncbi:hypothetical protein [Clostridium sp. Cult2]|uniref:hypothetical protein n=1 Tax=Clostridium sp. Cult2 TaxID=2079003 RepID=UPI001F35F5C2|nr:hypothetical protein [Clostridium sp. Cult2]MCF6464452.1 hypothetical protein [Clostridium sp. Cult2]